MSGDTAQMIRAGFWHYKHIENGAILVLYMMDVPGVTGPWAAKLDGRRVEKLAPHWFNTTGKLRYVYDGLSPIPDCLLPEIADAIEHARPDWQRRMEALDGRRYRLIVRLP